MSFTYNWHFSLHAFGIVVVLLATFAAICFVLKIWEERKMYRALWMDQGHKREIVVIERDEWIKTATLALASLERSNVHGLKKQITDQATRVDMLLNGDRQCVLGHKYYTGQGISCPHCGAEEAVSGSDVLDLMQS